MNLAIHTYLFPVACLAIGAIYGWTTAPDPKQTKSIEEPTAPAASPVSLVQPAATITSPLAPENPGVVDSSIEAAMRHPSVLHRRAALKRFFEAMDLGDFDSIFAKVQAISETEPEVLEMFARVWAERDPRKASLALLTLPEGTSRSRTLTAFARAWGRRDSAAALAWSEQALTGTDLLQAKGYIESRAAAQSPPKARSLEEIQSIGSEAERRTALSRHFRELIVSDPVGALKQAETLRDWSNRESMLATISINWAPKDPIAFMAWLKERETKNPSKGADWTTWTDSLSAASEVLMETDADQLHQIIESWPAGPLKRSLATDYAGKMIEQDPDAALAFVEDYKVSDPEFSVTAILPQLLAKDPTKGGEMLLAELAQRDAKDPESTCRVAVEAMKPWIEKDAIASANFATRVPERAMPSVFYEIANVWCARDGSAALQWASKLPAGKPKEHALREFTYIWAKHDTKLSTTWLNSLSNDSSRWAATEGFVYATIDADPDVALGWVRSIPDEKRRSELLARAWRKWNDNNSQSARDWLKNGDLSEQEREMIFEH